MKDNTYDIPAFKFGLLMNNTGLNLDEFTEEETEQLAVDCKMPIVPWEDLDGLTVRYIKILFGQTTSDFYFCCYHRAHNIIAFRMIRKIPVSCVKPEKLDDSRLDLLIQNFMQLIILGDNDDYYKKIARCFLERYQFANSQEVDSEMIRARKIFNEASAAKNSTQD